MALRTKKLFLSLHLKKFRSMINKFASLALFLVVSATSFAQNSTDPAKKRKRPDIPGTFAVEIGINRLTERPNNLKYGLWGSRSANVFYQYEMRILKSKFSFHPGIGLRMDRFKLNSFQKNYATVDTIYTRTFPNPTLIYDDQGNTTFVEAPRYIYDGDTLGQMDWSNSFRTKKSMLTMTYIDIPLELRFSTKPEDPARSVKIAIGGRVGYLLGGHTKIRYKENGDWKKVKDNQTFNLNPLRYSAHLKIYFGNFGIYGAYNFNTLFKEGKGPDQTKAQAYQIGIALHSF